MVQKLSLEELNNFLQEIIIKIDKFINGNLSDETLINRLTEIRKQKLELKQQKKQILENNPNRKVEVRNAFSADTYKFKVYLISKKKAFSSSHIKVANESKIKVSKDSKILLLEYTSNDLDLVRQKINDKFNKYIINLASAGVIKVPQIDKVKVKKINNSKPQKKSIF